MDFFTATVKVLNSYDFCIVTAKVSDSCSDDI